VNYQTRSNSGFTAPGPGPTLRCEIGDIIQITFLNQVDVAAIPGSLANGDFGTANGCDQATKVSSTGTNRNWCPSEDQFPNCLHASSAANIHFHGTHVTPSTTGDNVLVNIWPNTKVTGLNQASASGLSPAAGDRPDVIKPGPLPQNNRNADAAFDRTWFAPALAGRVGTSGRNQYYGPGLQNYDFAVSKDFALAAKLGEQTRLQFRADFFNLFNHTNFANPVSDLSNANFGKITQTLGGATAPSVGTTSGPIGGPRLIQLSLRIRF